MAVTQPLAFQAWTILVLCSGCTLAYTEYLVTRSTISSSEKRSSSAPTIASHSSEMIPRSLAIATAVSLWSPVIITGLIPASRHSSIAAYTSGLQGSIIPVRPMNIRSFSISSASQLSGILSYFLNAAHSTRRARSANDLFFFSISFFSSSVMGMTPSCVRYPVQRASITSHAPLVYWMMPLSFLCTVDIIFLPESKGASPILGCFSFSSYLGMPREKA